MRKKLLAVWIVVFFLVAGCGAGRVNMKIGDPGEPQMTLAEKIKLYNSVQTEIDKLKKQCPEGNKDKIEKLELLQEDILKKNDNSGNGMMVYDKWTSPGGAKEYANAYAIIKDADTRSKLAESHTSDASGNRQYAGVVINDTSYAVYIPHPEFQQKLRVNPNSSIFLFVNDIPKKISIYSKTNNLLATKRWRKADKTYNGVKINFGYRIMSIKKYK